MTNDSMHDADGWLMLTNPLIDPRWIQAVLLPAAVLAGAVLAGTEEPTGPVVLPAAGRPPRPAPTPQSGRRSGRAGDVIRTLLSRLQVRLQRWVHPAPILERHEQDV